MSGSHEERFVGPTAHDKRTLNDGAGGSAIDHSSAVKQCAQFLLCLGVKVSIGESSGIPSAKKNSGCSLDRLNKIFRIGNSSIASMEHGDIFYSEPLFEIVFVSFP